MGDTVRRLCARHLLGTVKPKDVDGDGRHAVWKNRKEHDIEGDVGASRELHLEKIGRHESVGLWCVSVVVCERETCVRYFRTQCRVLPSTISDFAHK